MKKIVLVIAFVIVSLSVNAQVGEAFKKDTENLVETLTKPAFGSVVDQFVGMVAEDKKEEFRKEIDETFPKLFEAMAKIYMEEFTHDEIKQLLVFYDTPVGQKMAKNAVPMAQKGMVAGQKWGIEAQSILAKFQ